MSHDASDLCAIHRQLAALSAELLRVCRERDWEDFAALREREAALLEQLRSFGTERRPGRTELARIEALIMQTLSNQREAQALLAPWREEIAAQLRSAGSSRKLAHAYGGRANSRA
jgi:hypothetical protein